MRCFRKPDLKKEGYRQSLYLVDDFRQFCLIPLFLRRLLKKCLYQRIVAIIGWLGTDTDQIGTDFQTNNDSPIVNKRQFFLLESGFGQVWKLGYQEIGRAHV